MFDLVGTEQAAGQVRSRLQGKVVMTAIATTSTIRAAQRSVMSGRGAPLFLGSLVIFRD